LFKQIAVVTGCAGFIGITFTKLLLSKGWLVYGIDKLTYVANTDELTDLKLEYSNFKFVEQDIKDIKRLPECDVV